jgi:protein O-GlcNAc transferase
MQSRAIFVFLLMTSCAAAQFNAKPSDDLSAKSLVSVTDFRIPARAQKEFNKANQLLAKQNLTQALQQLNKAIAKYPGYAASYNNLGVILGRLGDQEREREAYEKAISLDDHYALAYLNLGKLDIFDGNFADAEAALSKASDFDSSNPVTLILLSYSQLKDGHLEEALANTQRAHALSKPHAPSHSVAAWIFEQKGQFDRTMAELQMFLEEEPTGPRADAVRKQLEALRVLH